MDKLHTAALGILIVILIVLLLLGPQPIHHVINCEVAEISPDFTTEMRTACRNARMNK